MKSLGCHQRVTSGGWSPGGHCGAHIKSPGGTLGALGANYYQQFLLIVQLVAGKHMLNPQSVAEKHVFFWGP